MGAQLSSEEAPFMASPAEPKISSTRDEAHGTEAANQSSPATKQASTGASSGGHAKSQPQDVAAELDSARGDSTASEAQPPEPEADSKTDPQGDEDEDDEEGCAFCKFMKGGGCKAEFVAWEKCVADSRESGDFVGQCADITEALQACMNHADNKDYYQLFLDDQEEYVREQREKDQQEAHGADDSSQSDINSTKNDDAGSEVAPIKSKTATK